MSQSRIDPSSRVPPCDLDAEAAVLSALALDATGVLVDQVQTLLVEDAFYLQQHKLIYRAICTLREAEAPTDVVTIRNWLAAQDKWSEVGTDHLVRVLDGTPSVSNVMAHAQIVHELYRVRRLVAEAARVRAEGYSLRGADPETIQQFCETTEAKFADLSHIGEPSRLYPVKDVLVEVNRTICAAAQQKATITGVPSGFDRLDALTTGLQRGDIHIVAGRPSMGKSALVLGMALHIASEGYAVAFFSPETPKEQVGLRLLAMDSRIDLTRLRTGKLGPAEWTHLTDSLDRLSRLPLFINDTAGIKLVEIRADVRKLQREIDAGVYPNCTKQSIGAVCVDYLQLMQSLHRGRTREEEVADISKGLKRLAKQQDVPLVVVAQLNREVEKRPDHKPRLSDLRESGSIEQDADLVILVHRAEYYKPDDEDVRGLGELIVAKQRNGPTGSITVKYVAERTAFYNLAPDSGHDEYDDYQETFDNSFGGVP